MKRCPSCKREVHDRAVKCWFCGERFDEEPGAPSALRRSEHSAGATGEIDPPIAESPAEVVEAGGGPVGDGQSPEGDIGTCPHCAATLEGRSAAKWAEQGICFLCGERLTDHSEQLQEEPATRSGSQSSREAGGQPSSPHGGDQHFLGRLWRGDFGLARTYWFFGVFVGLAVTLLVKVLNLTDDAVGLALLALFSAPYGIVVLVGIWRASSKYTGSAVWRFLARAVVVLNGIGLVLTLVTFGLGISKDIEPFPQAADLLHRAEQGDPEAQNNLAAMYHFGEGVPQNHVEAAEWLRLAAEQGYALAQYNLGVMYHLGDGVSQSQVEAAKWFQLAAEQGHANAQNSLGALAARMTREQITEAQRLAAEWMDQHQGDN